MMPLFAFLKRALLGGSLAGLVLTSRAQGISAPDLLLRPPASPLLLKAGLRLTHFRYSYDAKAWQLLVPLSLGAEYRAAPRISLYGLLEGDVLASRTAARRRSAQRSSLPAAALSLGLRYYYGAPRLAQSRGASSALGRYLALDGGAEYAQLDATTAIQAARRRTVPATLTPALYALWGVQNCLRPALLYDLSAGLGLLAPAHHYYAEWPASTAHWNLGAQVNIRLYLSH